MVPPTPREALGDQPFEDSQQHYDGRPDDVMDSPSWPKGVQHGEDDDDDGDDGDDGPSGGDPMAPDVPLTSHLSMSSQQPKPTPTPKNTSRSGVSKASVTRKTDPFLGRRPWRGGSTKRKYSRKRNTRNRIRHTRRRTRR